MHATALGAAAVAGRVNPRKCTQKVHQRSRIATTRSIASDGRFDGESAYEVLNISPNASQDDVRRAFLKMSKIMHPDVRAESSVDGAMARVNGAYEALGDVKARETYDRMLRQGNAKSGIKGRGSGKNSANAGTTVIYEGLVGPLRTTVLSSLDVCEAEACALDVEETMIDSIRQWARTLAFTSEMPLPLPLSVDNLENGARIAFMRFDGGLKEAGALLISVESEEGTTRVGVRRSWSGVQSSFVPGEDRVLASFFEEFKFLVNEKGQKRAVGERSSRELGGIGSAIAAFFLPAIPFFGAASSSAPGGTYSSYHLKHDATYIDDETGF